MIRQSNFLLTSMLILFFCRFVYADGIPIEVTPYWCASISLNKFVKINKDLFNNLGRTIFQKGDVCVWTASILEVQPLLNTDTIPPKKVEVGVFGENCQNLKSGKTLKGILITGTAKDVLLAPRPKEKRFAFRGCKCPEKTPGDQGTIMIPNECLNELPKKTTK